MGQIFVAFSEYLNFMDLPIVSIKVSVSVLIYNYELKLYDMIFECILSMDSIIAFGWANEHSYLFFEIEARRWKEKLPDVHGVKELSTFYW